MKKLSDKELDEALEIVRKIRMYKPPERMRRAVGKISRKFNKTVLEEMITGEFNFMNYWELCEGNEGKNLSIRQVVKMLKKDLFLEITRKEK